MNLWICPWVIKLIILIDMGRPILLVGKTFPWSEAYKSEKWHSTDICIHLSLTVDAMLSDTSSSCHLGFSTYDKASPQIVS